MNPLDLKSIDDLQIIKDCPISNALSERDYFLRQSEGSNVDGFYPLGYGVDSVYIATFQGRKLLMQKGKSDLYLITDVPKFGFSLLHYILHTDNKKVRLSNSLPIQQLFYYKEEQIMNTLSSLNKMSVTSQLNSNNNQQSYQPVQSAPQQQQPQAVQPIQGTGMASATSVTKTQIASLAKACGYVIGYIAPVGPQIKMQLHKQTKKQTNSSITDTTYSIIAVESKPTKPIRILAALPKGVCMKDGRPASAEEILSCNIDYDASNTDLAYFCWQNDTAVAYIGAVGRVLPEYAPTHTNNKKHYAPGDILANKVPDMGYVEIVSRQNKSQNASSSDEYKWSLKSTIRRTLYTPNNFLPLKQLEHIPVKCNTMEDVHKINKIAFGSLKNKGKNNEPSRLETAYIECPQVIYERNYTLTVDGKEETVRGIGSAFFMLGEVDTFDIPTKEKDENGKPKTITKSYGKASLAYKPWYATSVKGASPETKTVTHIVNKNFEATKSDPSKERAKNIPIEFSKTYGDGKYNKYWSPFKDFLTMIAPCISIDELKSLTTRDSKRNSMAKAAWSNDIQESFLKLTRQENVISDHEALAQKYATEQLRASF